MNKCTFDSNGSRNVPKPLRRGVEVGKKEWIVEQFIALGAVVLIAAEKGSGKTALLLRLIEAVANGTLFLDELLTRKGKVLFIQCDEPEEDTLKKLRMMGLEDELCDVVWYEGTLNLQWLQDQLNRKEYLLIVVDSATNGLASENCEVIDTGFTRKLYKLGKMFSKAKVSGIITTHLNKTFDKKPRFTINSHDIAGLSTVANAITDIWGLIKLPQTFDKFRLNCIGKRNCRENTRWELEGNEEDLSFILASVGNSDEMPKTRRVLKGKIIDYLMEHHSYSHPQEISLAINSSEEKVRLRCTELYSEGLIQRRKVAREKGRPRYEYSLD